ncbi:matrixin family metalloprotease [Pyxidicoccus sp. MSG2]|uniref:matrixin family metalloprotease n=1 Tax=Pyxidicoccus sp. MSG2 TaxID=2996790 RepID=UPI00226F4B22|nr:matrixin family metalloprotease [Pyxidicoccus sp. MSG2]MCY1023811.1 matrixin family metalloprotease [Pyxidicoccus sp. MSG2]
MTKRYARSWVVPLALLGVVGCAKTGGDEALPVTPEDAHVTAWVPGTPVPAHAHAEGTDHTLMVDWILEEDSVDELTDHSALIINGRVESTRFDVIRAYAKSKLEGQPTGEASGIYNDLPVTIATVRVGDLARASQGLKTASGGALARGATVDVMFPGGLLADGCTLAPEDNPLPKVGEQAVFFLTPQGGTEPMASRSMAGIYAVTGGPRGRVLVQGGLVQGASSSRHAAVLEEHVGQPVDALLERVEARARAVAYVSPDARPMPMMEQAPHEGPTAQSWCGLPRFGYKWCRKPTNVTFTDYTGAGWPVGDAMNAWMYTNVSNSLYLYWRSSGASDVMVYEAYYGYTGWYGYAGNSWSGTCLTRSTIQLNDTYYSGAHYAKTVAIHEVGHSLGFAHYGNCNSIMYTDPTQCAAATTSCDAQAAGELYPY